MARFGTGMGNQSLSKPLRIVLSVLIVGHLAAVFLPPLSFQTRGPIGQSPAIQTLSRPVEGYGQLLYIDRGYAFFAPDPGPSHLVQAAVTDSAGQTLEMIYPNRDEQWPRLLYHRHFMLTEFLHEMYYPPGPPAELVELEPATAEEWGRLRERYTHLRRSYVDHLESVNSGSTVQIRRVEHRLPGLLDYQREPIPLTDVRLFQVLPDRLDLGDSSETQQPPETIPPPVAESELVEPSDSVDSVDEEEKTAAEESEG